MTFLVRKRICGQRISHRRRGGSQTQGKREKREKKERRKKSARKRMNKTRIKFREIKGSTRCFPKRRVHTSQKCIGAELTCSAGGLVGMGWGQCILSKPVCLLLPPSSSVPRCVASLPLLLPPLFFSSHLLCLPPSSYFWLSICVICSLVETSPRPPELLML